MESGYITPPYVTEARQTLFEYVCNVTKGKAAHVLISKHGMTFHESDIMTELERANRRIEELEYLLESTMARAEHYSQVVQAIRDAIR